MIIKAAADQGLLDIHDRKPLVLTAELAREWYPVGKQLGNVRNQGAKLILPTTE